MVLVNNIKLSEIFTKEYKKETEYRIFAEKILPYIKFKNNNYDMNNITNLANSGFISNFHVKYPDLR